MRVEMTRGALNLLTHLLSSNGWCSDVKLFYVAGKFLTEELDDQPAPPAKKEEQDRFVEEMVAVELSLDMQKCCRVCVAYHFKRGAFGINRHTMMLMNLFCADGE